MKQVKMIAGKICLLCYLLFLYQTWQLCQYGGVRRHMPFLLLGIWLFFFFLVLRLIAGAHQKEKTRRSRTGWVIFCAELAVCLGATVYFGGRILQAGTSYQGALAWKLEELSKKRQVRLNHNNFFLDGAKGVLEDLDSSLGLPEELYVSGSYETTFDTLGNIQTIEAFLYGKNQEGETETFLISYDAGQSANMTVWLNGQSEESYDEEKRLEPMLKILEEAGRETPCESLVAAWNWERGEETYGISYAGRSAFTSYDSLIFLSGDADGDGEENVYDSSLLLDNGGEIVAYAMSLYIVGAEDAAPFYYLMEPEYRSQEELAAEHKQRQAEIARESDTWTTDQSDGSMYYFYDDNLGWRLAVADAAAGSRFYRLEKTEDGGNTWEIASEDPFGGQLGVAAGLIFYDENFGIAGLAGASGSRASLYRTEDGGKTFTEIQLPMENVTELPDSAAAYGYTADDYDYVCMPEMEDGILTVRVVAESGETDGILFRSGDRGASWEWDG